MSNNESIFKVGNKVFVRTVTHYLVGEICFIEGEEVGLISASWIADTGRFHDALKNGQFSEVEPFPERTSFNRGSCIDITLWPHELPNQQK